MFQNTTKAEIIQDERLVNKRERVLENWGTSGLSCVRSQDNPRPTDNGVGERQLPQSHPRQSTRLTGYAQHTKAHAQKKTPREKHTL